MASGVVGQAAVGTLAEPAAGDVGEAAVRPPCTIADQLSV